MQKAANLEKIIKYTKTIYHTYLSLKIEGYELWGGIYDINP